MYPRSMFLSKNKKKHHNYSSENYHFYIREILQYIARACLRHDRDVAWVVITKTNSRLCPVLNLSDNFNEKENGS